MPAVLLCRNAEWSTACYAEAEVGIRDPFLAGFKFDYGVGSVSFDYG